MNINIGENIKQLRLAKNLTQAALAQRINVTKATISSYENGMRLPSYDVLMKLAGFFHVTSDRLLGFTDQELVDLSDLTPEQNNAVRELIVTYLQLNEAVSLLHENNLR